MTALRVNPAIRSRPFDHAFPQQLVVCEIPQRDGTTARYAVPATLLDLLSAFSGSRETSDIIDEFARSKIGAPSRQALERLINDFFVSRGFLIGDDAPSAVAHTTRSPSRPLLLRMQLLPASIVVPVASVLGWLFAARTLAIACAVVVAAHIWLYAILVPASHLHVENAAASGLTLAALLSVIGAVMHELGHAAAAARLGCKNVQIGCGLYYYYVVLYTDLSESWSLPRMQRALIDVAGIYFQSLYICAMLVLYWMTRWPAVLYAIIASDLLIASALNPVLRMDGYWLLMDVLGLTNLHEQAAKLARTAVARMFGRRKQEPWELGPRATIVLAGYTLLGSIWLLFMLRVVIDRLVRSAFATYPEAVHTLYVAATTSPIHYPNVIPALGAVLWRTLLLFGMCMFVYRALARMKRWAAQLGRLLQGREHTTVPTYGR